MGDQRARAELKVLWGRWTEVIALYAFRRQHRPSLDPRAYATLRIQIIAACQSLAETDGQQGSYYAGLEEMVRPWLSLDVLGRTDNELLACLLTRCRQI